MKLKWFINCSEFFFLIVFNHIKGWFIGPGNKLGEPLTIENVNDQLFGMVILNDWSGI